MKYRHKDGALVLKFTDDAVVSKIFLYSSEQIININFFPQCLQYKTEIQQDLRKIDKFMTNLMRHMVSSDK